MDECLIKKHERPPNPRATANPLSVLTFSWVLRLFRIGNKRELEVTDLYSPLKEHSANYLGDKFERIWNAELEKCNRYNSEIKEKEKKKKKVPSLLVVIAKALGGEILMYGIFLAVIEVCMRSLKPIFLGRLIRYFAQARFNETGIAKNATGAFVDDTSSSSSASLFFNNNQPMSLSDAYIAAAGIVFCTSLDVVIEHPYIMAVIHMGMKIHIGCVSLIYRKVLRLSKTALGLTTVGEIVNLLSNDVNRFDYSVLFINYLWVGPLQTMFIMYFIWKEIGISAVIGVLTLLAAIPMQVWLGKKGSVLRLKTAIKTDKRLRLMNEIISGIQVIKMYTWEKPFAKLVSNARRKEVDVVLQTSYIRSILMSFFMFHTRISIFISILLYVLQGHHINAEKVFVVTCFYNILRTNMTLFFPQGIALLAEAIVSVKRLENFMMYDEIEKDMLTDGDETNLKSSKTNRFDSMLVDPNKEMNEIDKKFEQTNHDSLPDNKNSVVLRDVTSKWSSETSEDTLSSVNLEVPKAKLTTIIGLVGSGKSSLLQVILKELPVKKGSIKVNGTVSFASQEPWLFSGSVRQNIIFGQKYDKDRYREVTKVCALHTDFAQFPYGDKTIVSDRGVSLSGGQRARINLARAVYKEADIYLLDDPLSAVDAHVGRHLFEECIMGYLNNKTRILVTHQIQYLNDQEHIVMLENGKVICNGDYKTLLTTGNFFAELLQASKDEIEDEEIIGPTESVVRRRRSSVKSIASSIEEKLNEMEPPELAEMRAVGTVSMKVYKEYFKASGTYFTLFMCVVLCILTQFLASYSDYWVTFWVNLEEESYAVIDTNITNVVIKEVKINNSSSLLDNISFDSLLNMDRNLCIYIFTVLTIATAVVTLVRTFLMYGMCVTASMNLHDNMFTSITKATMTFFNNNPCGRILNRFSKDMGSIDELLPVAYIDCISIGLNLIGIVGIVGFVNIWLLVPTFIITLMFYFMRVYYLTTSRSIKRLEGVTRSPVFSHLSASLQGLATIRAFNAERILEKEFDNHKDLHTSAWYMFLTANHAFGFWLDFFCVVYISLVTFSFLTIDTGVQGGAVGLAITQALALTGMFQWFMRQTAELENFMTSVERVLEYTDLESEKPLESPPDKKPPEEWPQDGKIEFSHVFLQYCEADPPVLKNLSFVVEPGEKVGIVGRTGAGKSSLISALYRLTGLKGEIYIDSIATSSIGLHELRSKISIIPQEPVLFSGTMRKNLDPFDEFPDDVLWNALEEVELKEAVNELSGGLNAKMTEGGSNFSVGQRQLVCLARAIVRNNKILVLDEATANIDPQTDALIQRTIRRKFADCTMLTIAHRLQTIMDCDKVLVMDSGVLMEFNHPHLLLQNKGGHFYKMVEQMGKVTSDGLHRIAASTYKKYIDED